jgi:hypothetical protein
LLSDVRSGSPNSLVIASNAATFCAPNRRKPATYAPAVRNAGGVVLRWNLSAYITSFSSPVSAR